MNEPGITALFSARMGMWNDRKATEDDYFTALANIALANLEALRLVRDDRDGWWIGSEGFGCHLTDPDDDAGIQAATDARDLEYAVWDLHLGVEPRGIAARLTHVPSPRWDSSTPSASLVRWLLRTPRWPPGTPDPKHRRSVALDQPISG